METRDSFGRTLDFDSQDTTSPSSVEELASGNTSLSCNALFEKEITDFIPQFFDNDSQSSAASDEQSIISRGNFLCCLLQQNTVASTMTNGQVNDHDGSVDDAQAGAGSDDEPYSTLEAKLSFVEFIIVPHCHEL
ncbi:hypothetical protein ZIOFF_013448 [Zingiber officinale]|uniref:Uncharacterized protein n=1 Tax=Zingiber officinale TaxID=94328 RepID=A0A8J5HG27_ZINOF|nr:hypothetical protein ZIOFF_013448 [Zingiber officinale]